MRTNTPKKIVSISKVLNLVQFEDKLFEKAEDIPHVRILKNNLILKDELNLVDDLKGHK